MMMGPVLEKLEKYEHSHTCLCMFEYLIRLFIDKII